MGNREELSLVLHTFGYPREAADRLDAEGMGPYELEHRITSTVPGEMGSLEYTHNIRKSDPTDFPNPTRPTMSFTEQDFEIVYMGALLALNVPNLDQSKALASETRTIEQAFDACKAMYGAIVIKTLEPYPGAVHRAFDSIRGKNLVATTGESTAPMSYEVSAAQLATDYTKHNRMGPPAHSRCLAIARTCEEQGILAALVYNALPDQNLKSAFMADMQAVATDTAPEDPEEDQDPYLNPED